MIYVNESNVSLGSQKRLLDITPKVRIKKEQDSMCDLKGITNEMRFPSLEV